MWNVALRDFHAAEEDFENMCGTGLYVASMQPGGLKICAEWSFKVALHSFHTARMGCMKVLCGMEP